MDVYDMFEDPKDQLVFLCGVMLGWSRRLHNEPPLPVAKEMKEAAESIATRFGCTLFANKAGGLDGQ